MIHHKKVENKLKLFYKNKITKSKSIKLFIFYFIVSTVAMFGSFFKPDAWYAELSKPLLMPPSWVFPFVWIILYAMIAAAGWLIGCQKKSTTRTYGLTWYAIQLIANGLWSYFFFGMHRPDLALIDIFILIVALVNCLYFFYFLSKLAFHLLLPYLAWLLFALYLNLSIYWLN